MGNRTKIARLTPLDLVMPRTYIGIFLTFRTTEPLYSILSPLQSGINQLLLKLPWLSGRVRAATSSDGKKILQLHWSEDEAACTIVNKGTITASYAASSDAWMPPETASPDLWPLSIAIDEQTFANGAPAFAASVFQFGDKQGVGLCICAHHNVVDATGLAEIIKLWTKCLSKAPIDYLRVDDDRCDRLMEGLASHLDSTSAQPTEILLAAHPEYSINPPKLPAEFNPNTCKLVQIPLSWVDTAKRNLEDSARPLLSTNTVLAALLWSKITQVRCLRTPELTNLNSKLVMAVNGRSRVTEELGQPSSPYFSNVVLYSLADLPVQAVMLTTDSNANLRQVCGAISEASSSEAINARFVSETYSLIDSLDDYSTIFPGWDLFGSKDLTITSWSDIPLYDMDFGPGLGTPEHVRAPYSEADGVCMVMPRKRTQHLGVADDEMLEVMVMLRKDDMCNLEQVLAKNS